MRAAYDTMMEVWDSGGPLTPGAFKFTVSCRLVLQKFAAQNSSPLTNLRFYVNYSGLALTAGNAAPHADGAIFKTYLNDVCVFPLLSFPPMQVFYTERIVPRIGTAYRRAHLILATF